MHALELQVLWRELRAERLLITSEGVPADSAHLADLEEEIAETSTAYIGAAVTEIATLRAELFGPQAG